MSPCWLIVITCDFAYVIFKLVFFAGDSRQERQRQELTACLTFYGRSPREAIQVEVKMEDIKQKIIDLLRNKLSMSLLPNVDEIEELITDGAQQG